MSSQSQTVPASLRRTGVERREQIVEAARIEFARTGLHGTSVEAVAQRAGISQPYVFRFFRTKLELFLAAVDRGFDRVQATMREAAESVPEPERLVAMGRAYRDLLGDRDELMLQMQAYTACADPVVREHVRRRFGELMTLVAGISGADDERLQRFVAHGMLLNVAAAMDLGEVAGTEWWIPRCIGLCAEGTAPEVH